MDMYDQRTKEGRLRGRAVEMTTSAERERYYAEFEWYQQDPCGTSCFAVEGVTKPCRVEGDES